MTDVYRQPETAGAAARRVMRNLSEAHAAEAASAEETAAPEVEETEDEIDEKRKHGRVPGKKLPPWVTKQRQKSKHAQKRARDAEMDRSDESELDEANRANVLLAFDDLASAKKAQAFVNAKARVLHDYSGDVMKRGAKQLKAVPGSAGMDGEFFVTFRGDPSVERALRKQIDMDTKIKQAPQKNSILNFSASRDECPATLAEDEGILPELLVYESDDEDTIRVGLTPIGQQRVTFEHLHWAATHSDDMTERAAAKYILGRMVEGKGIGAPAPIEE